MPRHGNTFGMVRDFSYYLSCKRIDDGAAAHVTYQDGFTGFSRSVGVTRDDTDTIAIDVQGKGVGRPMEHLFGVNGRWLPGRRP